MLYYEDLNIILKNHICFLFFVQIMLSSAGIIPGVLPLQMYFYLGAVQAKLPGRYVHYTLPKCATRMHSEEWHPGLSLKPVSSDSFVSSETKSGHF